MYLGGALGVSRGLGAATGGSHALYQGSNGEPWVAGCQIIALQKLPAKHKRLIRLISTCCAGSIYSLACLFCSPLCTIVRSRFLGFRLQVAKTKRTPTHEFQALYRSLASEIAESL